MKSIKHTNILIHTLLILGAFLFVGNACAESEVAEQNLPLQSGDYLSVEYIDLLNQTRSPMAANEQTDKRRHCNVDFDSKDKEIYLGFDNFHDPEALYVADSSLRNVKKSYDHAPAKLEVLSRSEFSIAIEGKTLIYRYVGDLKKYIARNTVAGQYTDNEGNLYTFTEEGLATLPDRSFEYVVPTDFMFGFDQINETRNSGAAYGFKVVNNKLQLFRIVGEFIDEPESKPFVTLTRIEHTEAKP